MILVLGLPGCGDDDDPIQPSSTTVEGRVVDLSGQPVGGIAVLVGDKPAVTTATDGSFTVADVGSIYDVTLIFSTEQAAIVYKGVSRRDPRLSYIEVVVPARSATISGNVPVLPTKRTMVLFVAGEVSAFTIANSFTGDYTLNPQWHGPETALSGRFYVLRWSDGAGGLPEDFDGYAVRDQTVSDAGTFTVNVVLGELTDPAENTLSGSVDVPGGYTLQTKSYGLDFGEARVQIDAQAAGSPDFTFRVPDLSELTFYASARAAIATATTPRATFYTRTGLGGGANGVVIGLEAAPQLSLPVHQATGVTTETPFVWSTGAGIGANIFVAAPSTIGTDPTYVVISTEGTTEIPDLSAQGLGLPAGTGYEWRVLRHIPFASMDEIASELLRPALGRRTGDTGTALSEEFEFTTQP
jgi:hypothetical protein